MGKHLVYFDCVSGSDGSKQYSIRLDPTKPLNFYDEEEFWQLMLNCFSATANAREHFLGMLADKGSITNERSLTQECAAQIQLHQELAS
jgi:hypothetical protein